MSVRVTAAAIAVAAHANFFFMVFYLFNREQNKQTNKKKIKDQSI